MIRLGPLYSPNMDFWQIMGALYLAGVPLGTHHVWVVVATKCGWLPVWVLQKQEDQAIKMTPTGSLLQAILAFGIPSLAAILGWRVPF